MKTASFFLSLAAALLFLAGVVLQLLLSGGLVWAEVEAALYGIQTQYGGLSLNCPILLAPSETGLVRAAIDNSTDEDVRPVVTAEISRAGGPQSLRQTVELAPHESRVLQWPVGAADVIFGRLILVNVFQARYSDLDPRGGECGILIVHLFSLRGGEALAILLVGGLALILLGGILWWRLHLPLDDHAEQTLRACASLAGATTLALLIALPRWWGLTLFLDVVALIISSVIFTDFVLFPKHDRN